jgi:serine phosphatase RsbU (regulator of sigma subunit)
LLPGQVYPRTDLTLDGGMLFMFSDGLSECAAGNGHPLGLDGIRALLSSVREFPRQERLDRIVAFVTRPGETFRDDLTLLALGA